VEHRTAYTFKMPHELMQQLSATPRTVAHLLAEVREAKLDSLYDGDWNLRTILAHLRDDESTVMRMRLVRMLAEDNPTFPDFDEQAWASNRSTARDRKEQLLGDFALQRQATLNILERLTPEQWEHGGAHEQSGAYTVMSWVAHWVEHDRAHVGQIEKLLGETLTDVLQRRAQDVDDLLSEDAAE
jgi:hypothetical protein